MTTYTKLIYSQWILPTELYAKEDKAVKGQSFSFAMVATCSMSVDVQVSLHASVDLKVYNYAYTSEKEAIQHLFLTSSCKNKMCFITGNNLDSKLCE